MDLISLVTYVDGYFWFGDRQAIRTARHDLAQKMTLKGMNPKIQQVEALGKCEVQDFAGVRVTQSLEKPVIILDSTEYTNPIANKLNDKKLHVPRVKRIEKEETEQNENLLKPCQKKSGELLWSFVLNRPDIGFAVSHGASHPSTTGAMRVFHEAARYLINEKVLIYEGGHNKQAEIAAVQTDPRKVKHTVMSDSDHARDANLKSRRGQVQMIGNCTINWATSKLPNITVYPHDSEMSAGSHACRDGLRIRNVINSNKFLSQVVDDKSVMLLDSESNVKTNNARELPKKSRHVQLCDLYMREQHQNSRMPTAHLPRLHNSADMMTHECGPSEHRRHCESIGIIRKDQIKERDEKTWN